MDLRRPLPVATSHIELIFSEHFLEHISRDEGRRLLSECYRVLKPGGVIRISTPNLEKLVDQYSRRRITEWHDMNWTPETPCCLLNEGLRLWGHQFVYDTAELTQALRDAGFHEIEPRLYRSSAVAGLNELETRPFHDEIIVEATKS